MHKSEGKQEDNSIKREFKEHGKVGHFNMAGQPVGYTA